MINKGKSYVYNGSINLLSTSGTLSQPYQYIGQHGYYREEFGLYLLSVRWYDSEVGRFISKDLIGEKGGINLYEYVRNNVVNLIDPFGDQVHFPVPSNRGNTYLECLKLLNDWWQQNLNYCRHWWVKIRYHGCVEECMGYDPGGWVGGDRSGDPDWYFDGSVWVKKGVFMKNLKSGKNIVILYGVRRKNRKSNE